MSKKILITTLGIAAISLSSAAFADITTASPDVYLGIQAGYGDTHWNDANFNQQIPVNIPAQILGGDPALANVSIGQSSKDTGFAGRVFAGYDYNQYLAVESGFTYFPKTTVKQTVSGSITDLTTQQTSFNNLSTSGSFNTYGIDLLGKISVPIVDNFGLYAKAGPGYLHSTGVSGLTGSTNNVDLVYGFGADYAITPHLVADVSFTRFNGNHKITNSNYQPDADLYAAGLAYKFNV